MGIIKEFKILVPVHPADDKGNPITTQHTPFQDIMQTACESLGGCTLGPEMDGAWFHEGTGEVIQEKVRALYIAHYRTPKVRAFAEDLCYLLNQHCIYFLTPDGVEYPDASRFAS